MVAKVIQSRIIELADANSGEITPDMVVADAKRADSPIHEHFEARGLFNPEKCMEVAQLNEARYLIRGVPLRIKSDKRTLQVPRYVRDPSKGSKEQGYISADRIKSDEDRARDALIDMFKRVGSMVKTARDYGEYFALESELAELEQRIAALQEAIIERPSAVQ